MGKWPTLDKIEMVDGPIEEETYERDLRKLQSRLLDVQLHYLQTGGRAIICIDGWDAAGKGGLIGRVVDGLEPKSVHVWRIGAPSPEEQGRHYLWRFWQRLPVRGDWATAPGMAASWSNGSRASATKRRGSEPTARSTSSNGSLRTMASESSSSWCMSARRNRSGG